jgi:pyrroline-5-carboxylate reductase
MDIGNIAFIGAGNMGRALIGALLRAGVDAAAIRAADPDPAQLARARELGGIRTANDNATAVQDAATVVLGVKPQSMAAVCGSLRSMPADTLVVSVAAGVGLDLLARWLGERPIVRAMPNTPALLGAGVTAMVANARVSDAERERAVRLLAAAGHAVVLDDERLMDPVTAVSGSGPAYFFLLMEAMVEAARDLGLPAGAAHTLVTLTALGAARMATAGGTSPAELRRQVTSPNGTTERALAAFEAAGLRDIVTRAVRAANDRAVAIARELEDAR